MATEQDILEQSTPQDLFRFLVRSQHPKTAVTFWIERWELAMLERVVTEDVDQLDTRLDGLQAMAQWLNEEMAKRVEKSDGATFRLLESIRERIMLQVLGSNCSILGEDGKDLRTTLARVWDDPEGRLVAQLTEKLKTSPNVPPELFERK
jgi:hypothetical protein